MVRFADLKALCAGASLCVITVVAAAQDVRSPAVTTESASSGAATTAATTAAPLASTASNPIVRAPGETKPVAPQVPAVAAWHGRMISSDVAAQLAAAAPKYTPAAPKPPPKQLDDEEQPSDVDQPKNHIIHLPRYVVHAPPPPILNERTVNTQKGLEDIAMRRYLTDMDRALNKFTLPLFGTSAGERALEMYREDERLKNMADLSEDAKMVSATDKAAGLYVKKQVDQTFIRPADFDWKPIGR